MQPLEPADARELAETLAEAASRRRGILVFGAATKDAMGGPLPLADLRISTRRLNRVLAYDPEDLTISVEAGMPYAEFSRLLEEHGQMAPLDPPFAQEGTIGGILAANLSGPRRRLYGSARDMLIGLKLATLEGKLVESGGMVVKNAAGFDLGRPIIGSFGTLAVIVSANFRVFPIPPAWRTFLRSFPAPEPAIAERDRVLRSVLSPAALDLLHPEAARRLGYEGYLLALEAGGSEAVLDRYARELAGWGRLGEAEAAAFWAAVREFTPAFVREHPQGAVVRVTTNLSGLSRVLDGLTGPVLARAGSGILWAHFDDCDAAQAWVRGMAQRGYCAVIEFAPPERKAQLEMWPAPGADFTLMQRLKDHFDPHRLLNRGRLYGRL